MENLQEKLNNYVKSIEEKHRIEKILINILKFLSILAISLIFGHYFNKCSKTEQIKVNTKDIRNNINDIDSIISVKEVKRDTVLNNIIQYKYLLGKDKKYFIHDTIRIDSLIYLSQKQDTIIKIDSSLIVDFKNKITKYQKLDTIQQKQIDSLINAPRGRLKAFCIGVGIGFIVGSVVK